MEYTHPWLIAAGACLCAFDTGWFLAERAILSKIIFRIVRVPAGTQRRVISFVAESQSLVLLDPFCSQLQEHLQLLLHLSEATDVSLVD